MDCLIQLLEDLQSEGHGATLLFVPDDDSYAGCLDLKYRVDSDILRQEMIKSAASRRHHLDTVGQLSLMNGIPTLQFKDYRRIEAESYVHRASLNDYISFTSNLGRVDGALVVSHRFSVRGFGAEIVNVPSVEQVLQAEDMDGLSGREIDIRRFGTRHRSAFRFCAAVPDALAFILSQDGGIKVAKAVDGRVVLWKDLTLRMYAM